MYLVFEEGFYVAEDEGSVAISGNQDLVLIDEKEAFVIIRAQVTPSIMLRLQIGHLLDLKKKLFSHEIVEVNGPINDASHVIILGAITALEIRNAFKRPVKTKPLEQLYPVDAFTFYLLDIIPVEFK